MARDGGTNAFVVLGIVCLLIGGVGVVLGQVALQLQEERGGDQGGDDGSLVDVTVDDGSGGSGSSGGGGQHVDYRRVSRLGGIVLLGLGGFIAVVGATLD